MRKMMLATMVVAAALAVSACGDDRPRPNPTPTYTSGPNECPTRPCELPAPDLETGS